MFRQITLVCLAGAGLVMAAPQEKSALVVHAFTPASGVKFPYDMTELQKLAVAEIKDKDGAQFEIVADAADQARVYVLDGEVLEWHKGNTVERMAIAMGSVVGRENAKLHYWLTDKNGKRVFEQTDTIRQGFMKNGHRSEE